MAEEAAAAAAGTATGTETLQQLQARHRKEAKDLQGRITSKKKNATKKTRKFVNDECAELERALKERQEGEVRALSGEPEPEPDETTAQEEEEEEEQGKGDEVNGELAAGLKSVRFQEPAQQQQPQQQPQQNGGGQQPGGQPGEGKKRNRQKDRLARRTAEAEAAAIAAESEAANMTDYRSIERGSMLKQFETHGLEEKEIAPDGHCLFSAVADQLALHGVGLDVPGYAGDKPQEAVAGYRKVRHVAAGYMTSHADDYAPFMEEPLGGYVAKIRDTAEWGGQLELSALANAYGVEIKVVKTDGRTEVIRPNGVEGGEKEQDLKTVWLAYYKHGYGLGEHYNSLRRKGGEGK